MPYPIVEHLVSDLHRKPFLTACSAVTNRVGSDRRFIPNILLLFLANCFSRSKSKISPWVESPKSGNELTSRRFRKEKRKVSGAGE
jgi:hypothetical protein